MTNFLINKKHKCRTIPTLGQSILKLAIYCIKNGDKTYIHYVEKLQKHSLKIYNKLMNKYKYLLYLRQKVILCPDMIKSISSFLENKEYYYFSICSKNLRKHLLSSKWLPTVMYDKEKLEIFLTNLYEKISDCNKEALQLHISTINIVKIVDGLDQEYNKMYNSHYKYCRNYNCLCRKICNLYNRDTSHSYDYLYYFHMSEYDRHSLIFSNGILRINILLNPCKEILISDPNSNNVKAEIMQPNSIKRPLQSSHSLQNKTHYKCTKYPDIKNNKQIRIYKR